MNNSGIGNSVQAAPAVRALSASQIRLVANAAMGRPGVLAFWFGEADQQTPSFIREAGIASIANGETFYTQNLGRPYLRQAIASYLTGLHGRPIDEDRIAVTGSGVSALMITDQLVMGPGDRVVAVTPMWPNITEIPKILRATVERIPVEATTGRWALDVDRLLEALTPGTRALLVNSPNNPTGWTITDEQVRAVLDHCRRHGIWIMTDEVYERLVYDKGRRSAPSFLDYYEEGDRIIGTNSFSKAWSMTGWRIGWAVVPKALSPEIAKLIEFNTSSVFEPAQRAAVVAIENGEAEVARLRSELAGTRAFLVEELRRLPGVEVPDAGGAMYVFFKLAGRAESLPLAIELVEKAGLGLAPGCAFGPEAEGWLRWCHATSRKKLAEGVARLEGYLKDL